MRTPFKCLAIKHYQLLPPSLLIAVRQLLPLPAAQLHASPLRMPCMCTPLPSCQPRRKLQTL